MSNKSTKATTTTSAKKVDQQKRSARRLLIQRSRQSITFVVVTIAIASIIYSLFTVYYSATEPAQSTTAAPFFDQQTINQIKDLGGKVETPSGRINPFTIYKPWFGN